MTPRNDNPKVSCLMVTADRPLLAQRAIRCYRNQTYENKELVIIDDGKADMEPLLVDLPPEEVVYIKLEKKPENTLGGLRNISLEAASGAFILQWDDDDWIHPERIEKQVRILQQGYDACALYGSIMHLDTPEFFRHPYIGYLKNGWPGSIMHRRDPRIRFPELRKAEDSVYLHQWMKRRFVRLPAEDSYLHIRCYHGNNTWDKKHFLTKMRNTFSDLVSYGWHRYIRHNLLLHSRFHLSARDREAFERYLQDSMELGIFKQG